MDNLENWQHSVHKKKKNTTQYMLDNNIRKNITNNINKT